jgi:hypothetical protein
VCGDAEDAPLEALVTDVADRKAALYVFTAQWDQR